VFSCIHGWEDACLFLMCEHHQHRKVRLLFVSLFTLDIETYRYARQDGAGELLEVTRKQSEEGEWE
jgi:hypothetical protein